MTADKKQVAESFSKHNFEKTIQFMAENIEWNMVGASVTSGKQDVIHACRQSNKYLENVKVSFSKFEVYESSDSCVVDSVASYTDQDNNVSEVASCDIYSFENDLLKKIRSYCIELKA